MMHVSGEEEDEDGAEDGSTRGVASRGESWAACEPPGVLEARWCGGGSEGYGKLVFAVGPDTSGNLDMSPEQAAQNIRNELESIIEQGS